MTNPETLSYKEGDIQKIVRVLGPNISRIGRDNEAVLELSPEESIGMTEFNIEAVFRRRSLLALADALSAAKKSERAYIPRLVRKIFWGERKQLELFVVHDMANLLDDSKGYFFPNLATGIYLEELNARTKEERAKRLRIALTMYDNVLAGANDGAIARIRRLTEPPKDMSPTPALLHTPLMNLILQVYE